MTDVPQETWFSTTWRPAMAWQYFTVCAFDFILFPIGNAAFFGSSDHFQEWRPLTLQNGGLYHMAMGAIIGVTSWQRSQEKMAVMRSDAGSYTESSATTTVVSKDTTKVEPANASRAD